MAYSTTAITPVVAPKVAPAPTLNTYKTPNVATVTPTLNTANTGYKAPASTFTENNLNTGLLDYDPSASKNLTFDGREIDASAVGANIKQTTPNFAPADNYLTNGAFVENRINGLLEDPNNTLNQRMRANGMADAGSRGLQNTTMGATIGQSVMADKAIQIATPDAATQAQGDLSRQGAAYASQRANQDATNQGSLAEQAGKINSALSAQTSGQSWDSTQQKAVIQGELNTQGAAIEGAKTTQKAEYDAQARDQQGLLEGAATTQKMGVSAALAGMESVSAQNLTILQSKLESAGQTTKDQNAAIMQQYTEQQELIRTTVNNEYNKATSQAQLNAAQRDSLSGAMTTMAKDYEVSIQNIMLDPNLDATSKNAAIIRINKVFNQDMSNISSIFGASYTKTTT